MASNSFFLLRNPKPNPSQRRTRRKSQDSQVRTPRGNGIPSSGNSSKSRTPKLAALKPFENFDVESPSNDLDLKKITSPPSEHPPGLVSPDVVSRGESSFSQRLVRNWWYKDLNGEIHGPFSDNQMRQWYDQGYLPVTLPIRFDVLQEFEPMSVWFDRGDSLFLDAPVKSLRSPFGVMLDSQEPEGHINQLFSDVPFRSDIPAFRTYDKDTESRFGFDRAGKSSNDHLPSIQPFFDSEPTKSEAVAKIEPVETVCDVILEAKNDPIVRESPRKLDILTASYHADKKLLKAKEIEIDPQG